MCVNECQIGFWCGGHGLDRAAGINLTLLCGGLGQYVVSLGKDVSDPVACAFDGHEGAVDVGERALEGGEVGDGRRAHCRDGLALGLDGT